MPDAMINKSGELRLAAFVFASRDLARKKLPQKIAFSISNLGFRPSPDNGFRG